MTHSRRSLVLAAATMLLIPLWGVIASGLVQVRACVPTLGLLGDAHLMFLRPAADCPSGTALDESGLLAVVGTIALTSLAAHLAAIGALTGLGAAAARAAVVVRRLLDAVLPGRRAPRGAVVRVERPVLTWATALVGMVGRSASTVVGLRAPPVAA